MTTENIKIEYRVRKVERYIVTRWYSVERSNATNDGGCEERGEFDHADTAYEVAYALARNEHQQHGWPVGDERIQYPVHPTNDAVFCDPNGILRHLSDEATPPVV